MFGLPYGNELLSLRHEEAATIRKNFQYKEAQLPDWLGIEFYGNEIDSVIGLIKNDAGFDLMYASNSQAHFEKMDNVLRKSALS